MALLLFFLFTYLSKLRRLLSYRSRIRIDDETGRASGSEDIFSWDKDGIRIIRKLSKMMKANEQK